MSNDLFSWLPGLIGPTGGISLCTPFPTSVSDRVTLRADGYDRTRITLGHRLECGAITTRTLSPPIDRFGRLASGRERKERVAS